MKLKILKLRIMKNLLILILLLPLISFTQEKANWDFPVKPGSEEWKTFKSSEEMVAACQMPDYVLNSISTEELLMTCLRYPMFLDIHFANNIQDGLDIIIPSFNGLVELFNRDDCPEVLMDKYSKETPCDVKLKKGNNTLKLFYLELLISQEHIINQLEEKQREKLLKESLKKINAKQAKKHSQFYELSSALILSRLLNYSEVKNKITSEIWLDRFNKKGILIDSANVSKLTNIANEYISKNE